MMKANIYFIYLLYGMERFFFVLECRAYFFPQTASAALTQREMQWIDCAVHTVDAKNSLKVESRKNYAIKHKSFGEAVYLYPDT